MGDQGISTQLLVPSGSVCFSYAGAPWRLFLRKEVGARAGRSLASLGGGRGAGRRGASLGPQQLLSTHRHWGPLPQPHLLRPGRQR